jgi:hypothetical protein
VTALVFNNINKITRYLSLLVGYETASFEEAYGRLCSKYCKACSNVINRNTPDASQEIVPSQRMLSFVFVVLLISLRKSAVSHITERVGVCFSLIYAYFCTFDKHNTFHYTTRSYYFVFQIWLMLRMGL